MRNPKRVENRESRLIRRNCKYLPKILVYSTDPLLRRDVGESAHSVVRVIDRSVGYWSFFFGH